MGSLSPVHLIILLVIVLLVIGPGKLPEVGSALGKTIREFRKATTDELAEPAVAAPAPVAAAPTPAASAPAAPAPVAVAPAPAAPASAAPAAAAALAPAPLDGSAAQPGIELPVA